MSRLRDNPGAGRVLVLWCGLALLPAGLVPCSPFTAALFAQGESSALRQAPPANPSTPDAPKGATAPKSTIATPSAPTSPNDPARSGVDKSTGTGDRRLVDLAKRLSTDEATANEKGSEKALNPGEIAGNAAAVATRGDIIPTAADESQKKAAASNSLKLADPDDAKPLSARAKHGDAAPPGTKPSDSGSGTWVLNGITALGIVIVLIFVMRGALRRYAGAGVMGRHPAVQVLSRVPVAPRNHVLLIRVGQRVLVVGDSAAGLRTLAAIDEPEEVAELIAASASAKSQSISAGFRSLLHTFSGKYPTDEQDLGGDEQEYQVDRARDGVASLAGKLRHAGQKGGDA